MVVSGPLIGSLLSLLQGVVYTAVGWAVARRRLEGDAYLANVAFSLFWYALGVLSFIGAATSLAALAGLTDLPLHITIVHVALLGICAALWGLVYYFAYLFTGRRGWLGSTAVFYAAFFFVLVYLIAWREPIGVVAGDWSMELDYVREFPTGWPTLVLVILLLGPPLAGAVSYLTLYFRVDQRVQKYRIGMVAGSIAVWMMTSLIASFLDLAETTWWNPVSRGIGLAVAILVFAAFRPPAWVRRRLGVEGG